MNDVKTMAGCQMVGKFVDEGDSSATSVYGCAEVVRPQIVANFANDCGGDGEVREFTVLLQSNWSSQSVKWRLEAQYPGELPVETSVGVGQPSRWITFRAIRVLEWYSTQT
jgi:hypothetical protein